jgi:hypothetical protein
MKSASWVCIGGYTFRMKSIVWILALAILAGLGYWIWLATRRYAERKREAEARFSTFMAQSMRSAAPKVDATPVAAAAPVPAAAPAADLGVQKLLFEAAAKAGEAGEPALSIQLYARLIARYPNGVFLAQARAAAEQQKSKLARP